jgi:hypothetical protein
VASANDKGRDDEPVTSLDRSHRDASRGGAPLTQLRIVFLAEELEGAAVGHAQNLVAEVRLDVTLVVVERMVGAEVSVLRTAITVGEVANAGFESFLATAGSPGCP